MQKLKNKKMIINVKIFTINPFWFFNCYKSFELKFKKLIFIKGSVNV